MPIIAIDLSEFDTALLDAVALDQKRSRKAQALVILETWLRENRDRITDECICPDDEPATIAKLLEDKR